LQTLKPFPTVDPHKFTSFLDSIFGFQNQNWNTNIICFLLSQVWYIVNDDNFFLSVLLNKRNTDE
jgi:hypothetical protein